MNSRHRRTLGRIFAEPTPADLRWRDIEALLRAAGPKSAKVPEVGSASPWLACVPSSIDRIPVPKRGEAWCVPSEIFLPRPVSSRRRSSANARI
jgi:hypothetical protein